ncbi:MAG TPA: vWA domain-containing protein [Dissulfurispiraceae bacterium]|nr:vWA domain-containing protein [Dissulfurispiraceae bacterium]
MGDFPIGITGCSSFIKSGAMTRWLAMVFLVFLVLLVCQPAISQGADAPPAAASIPETASAPPQKVQTQVSARDSGADVVLLMDSSGSMKKTDPSQYRKEAAKLLISLLGDSDNVGVVGFGERAEVLASLTSSAKKNREALFGAVAKIGSNEPWTNITEAVRQGASLLEKSQRNKRVILLMSDGKLDLGTKEKDAAATAELADLLTRIAKSGIQIHTVAFSDMSDAEFLRDIAAKTGGAFRFARNDKDIHVMFASLFERIKAPDSLALEGDSFRVDRDIKEVVLLVNKNPGTATVLFEPSGKQLLQSKFDGDVEWFGSKVFDMITIREPAPGTWKIKLSTKEGNKIFVLTNLKLRTTFARDAVAKDEKIVLDAWLERDGAVVQNSDVLSQMEFFCDLVYADGTKQRQSLKPTGKEGVFAAEIAFPRAGDSTMALQAGGKTFNRARELVVHVSEPPAAAPQVSAPEKGHGEAEAHAEGLHWQHVLLQFIGANALLIGLIASAWGVRKGLVVVKARRANAEVKKENKK